MYLISLYYPMSLLLTFNDPLIRSQLIVRKVWGLNWLNDCDATQYGDHLTSVFGRVCSTRRVVFVQPLQDILNPPELFLNVPVYQLTLGGEQILLDKLFSETRKTCIIDYTNAFLFSLIIKNHKPFN